MRAAWLAMFVSACTASIGTDDGGMVDLDGDRAQPDGHVQPGVDAGPQSCDRVRPDVSSAPAGASWRYGGGVGYPDILDPAGPCTVRVSTREELEAALMAAAPGHAVYVDDDASIDLTGASLCVNEGVTLASGRGRGSSAGARLFTTARTNTPILQACGDGARITGLRILGNDPDLCPVEWPSACTGPTTPNCRDCTGTSDGVRAFGVADFEIDNCELAGWSFGAVRFQDGVGHRVHHDYIHHNQRTGLGYGVVMTRNANPVDVLVEHNRFDYDRHAVAGSGEPGQSYEARENLSLPHANGHVFDMHGQNEGSGDGSPWAGHRIVIHDNVMLPPDGPAVIIRGRPQEGAWIFRNCIARGSADAVIQRNFFGNFHVDVTPEGASQPNAYSQSAGDCGTVRLCAELGARGPLLALAESGFGLSSLAIGDFDGDGRADVFRPTGTEWVWLSGGTGSWTHLNASSAGLSTLAIGDFDGDGRTDVFIIMGGTWRFSSGGSRGWADLRAGDGDALSDLAFGDFDGDGRTDVFRATGSEWQVSDGGTAAWRRLNLSTASRASLAFDDFDGDGRTDVFRATGSEWQVSDGGSSSWRTLNASSYGLGSLAIADVDGDGHADVLMRTPIRWRVSRGGTRSWEDWAITSRGFDEVRFADFDGDGSDDAFSGGCL